MALRLTAMDRRETLEHYLKSNPNDAFARYGLAMELMRAGEAEASLEQFRVLRESHADYIAAYQQAGQLLIQLGRGGDARPLLAAGIEHARRQGNFHASREMESLLAEAR